MKLVTEGIDAIAATRVLIRGENSHTSIHAYTGETVHRTFRYGILYIYVCVCARARACVDQVTLGVTLSNVAPPNKILN